VRMLRFDISGVLDDYPGVNIGVLVGRGLDNKVPFGDLLQLQKEALVVAQEQLGDQPPTKHPHISSWREVYRSFGSKPSDYRPSAEALIRRALKTGKLPRINNAVDLYNVISVKHVIPMGGFDTDNVDGDIYLRLSEGGEKFLPLGASEHEKTYTGEVVYADDARILTRRWNYRDADETKITEETTNLVLFIDASPSIEVGKVDAALSELMDLLKDACGGKMTKSIASYNQPVIHI
jgi:DNA/RNA-binding domain of Phe-tRNA-synthetase-like protein